LISRGGRDTDLPGVGFPVVRGAIYASAAMVPSNTNKADRTQRRSKYGVKRPKK
jgi:small subunit ribosomal protein S12